MQRANKRIEENTRNVNQNQGRPTYSSVVKRSNSIEINDANEIIRSANTTSKYNNTGDLMDFISLTNEVRELTKTFNIKKMLQAIKEFKQLIMQCNSTSQQFQTLIQFCDKLDNE